MGDTWPLICQWVTFDELEKWRLTAPFVKVTFLAHTRAADARDETEFRVNNTS